MIRRLGKIPEGILAGNGVLVLVALWLALDRGFDLPHVVPAVSQAGPSTKTGSSQPGSPSLLEAFRNRPLFASNRKMATQEEIAAAEAAEAIAAEPPPPPRLTGYRLTGTLVGAGKKIAFVQPEGNTEATSVPVGGSVEGWQLTDVDSHQAVFELQGIRTVLSFVFDGGSTAPGADAGTAGTADPASSERAASPQNSDGPGKPSKARLYRPPKRQ